MQQVEALHEQAMDIAEEAFAAERRGDVQDAKRLFQDALILEGEAASTYPATEDSEPTRSILYRSAAALAFHAGDFERAEQLVSNGLAGHPPLEIKGELRALRDDIDFRRHIQLHGIELTDDQIKMTLWGDATGYGIISAELLIKRIEQIRTIFYRTVERMAELPYRVSGKPPKLVTEHYGLFLNALVPGSFGVTFTIGQPVEQLELFPELSAKRVQPSEVIHEVITCFELIQEESNELHERFKDENYYQNFVALAKQMAPDGEQIKVLGLSTQQDGNERTVGLRQTRKKIELSTQGLLEIAVAEKQESKIFVLEGILKVADSLTIKDDTGQVKLIDDEGKSHSIRVPISQMQDVVQPYFEEPVKIKGYKKGRSLYLTDIGDRGEEFDAEVPSLSDDLSQPKSLFD